jgi:hypothetical protein
MYPTHRRAGGEEFHLHDGADERGGAARSGSVTSPLCSLGPRRSCLEAGGDWLTTAWS